MSIPATPLFPHAFEMPLKLLFLARPRLPRTNTPHPGQSVEARLQKARHVPRSKNHQTNSIGPWPMACRILSIHRLGTRNRRLVIDHFRWMHTYDRTATAIVCSTIPLSLAWVCSWLRQVFVSCILAVRATTPSHVIIASFFQRGRRKS